MNYIRHHKVIKETKLCPDNYISPYTNRFKPDKMYLCISFRTCLLHVIKLTSVYNFVQPIALRVNSNACKFAVQQYQFFATMETRAQKSQSRRVQEQRDQFRFASYND